MRQDELAFVFNEHLDVSLDGLGCNYKFENDELGTAMGSNDRERTVHKLKKLLSDESGTGNDYTLHDIKVDMSEDSLHHVLVELVQRLIEIISQKGTASKSKIRETFSWSEAEPLRLRGMVDSMRWRTIVMLLVIRHTWASPSAITTAATSAVRAGFVAMSTRSKAMASHSDFCNVNLRFISKSIVW